MTSYSNDDLCLNLLEETETLNNILNSDNVNEQVNNLISVLTNNINKCAPIVTRVIKRPPAPWINNDIVEAMKLRDHSHTQLKANRSSIPLQATYKHLKKKTKSLIKQAKNHYYRNEVSNSRGNISATWKIIKDIIPGKKNSHNISFDDPMSKAEEFNNFFANVGKNTYESTKCNLQNINQFNSHSAISTAYNRADNVQKFRPQPIDVNTVILTIKHLNSTKSFGSDNISLRFIKDSLFVTVFYLTHIINTSIVTGIFPDTWKHAVVIPLHKNGDM